MATYDIFGRPYAKLSELKEGSQVIVDDSFTCMRGWTSRVVLKGVGEPLYSGDKMLYVLCGRNNRTHHFLDGQLDADGETLIGIYHAEGCKGEDSSFGAMKSTSRLK